MNDGGPIFLVAGGSGVVPFRAMLRHRLAAGEARAAVDARLRADAVREGVATALVNHARDPAQVHTERFGPYTR